MVASQKGIRESHKIATCTNSKDAGFVYKLRLGVSICLDVVSIETLDLDTEKKSVSTVEISRSRSRNLDFVSTPPSSLKSLDQDLEICRDMTFLANLDSLSWSQLRVGQFYHISRSRFVKIFDPEVSQKVSIMLKYLNKSWKVSTNLKNLNKSWKSQQSWWKYWCSQVSIEKSWF